MKKFLLKCFFVVFFSLIFSTGQANAQSVGDQTLISVNSWNAYVHLPSGYSANPTTSYPTIIFMPGLGEVGTNAAKLLVAGPSKFIASGWNGVVTVDGASIEPIIISLQPSSAWAVESAVNTRIQTLKSMYRIDPNRLYLTGLSMGGWESLTFVTADPYDSTAPYGPFTYASQVAAVVGVQSVKPEDNTPYPDLFDNFARIGGKLLAFEQVNDGRDTQTYVNRMNSVVSGSAIFKSTSFGGGGHCCWDEFYDPVKTFSGLNGRTESIYQWMLRQSLGGSTPPPPSNISPTANAGTDQTITLPTSSLTLVGTGTDPDGTITSFSWTKLSGGSATITSPSASTTTVIGLTQGTYTFRLTVTDNGGLTAADDVNIVVNAQTTGGGKTIILNATATGEIYKSDMSSLNIQPCDTIAIPAGNYTNGISIGFSVGFSGSASCPVTIINSGGKVQAKYFRIYNSQYFKMTGSGSADQYGFLISGDTGATGLAIGRQTSDYEVERVESSNNSTAFIFKVNPVAGDPVTQYPNWVIKNVKIHDNYIHDISGEGMYIGHTDISGTSYSGGLVPVQMQNVKIYNNRVENTDWDGIQLSDARQGAELYNNTVTNYGRINLGSQQSGIILGGNTTGSVYNNTVKTGTGSGISVFGYGDVSVTNNVLENTGTGTRQDSMYLNDNRVTLQTNPGLRVAVSGNVIKNPNAQATAIKNANYNSTSLPGSITNNTICDGSGRSLSQLITSGAGDTISGNILSATGCTTTPPPTDTTPPTTSLTSPTNNQTLSGTVTLSATATDNTGVTKVDFYRGTTLLGSDTTSPYTYSWNTTTSTNGTYQLSTKAYDSAGNVGTSTTVSVVVNNTTTPPPGGGGAGSGGGGTTGSGGGSGTTSSGGGGGISIPPQTGSGNTQQNTSNQNSSVRVNVDTHLRVRSTPGGVQITQIANGATGILLEENTQIIQGYTWVKVKFSNGVEGWVAKDFLISDVSATNQSQQNSAAVSVTAQQLNVRILPGGEILSRVAIGSTGVLVIDQEQIKNNLTWVKVKFSNGVEGWVAKDFLSFSNSTQLSGGSIQTTANLRVRTTPNGVIMTIVPLGSLGTITQGSKTDAWVKVKFSNGVEGWVSSTYIK